MVSCEIIVGSKITIIRRLVRFRWEEPGTAKFRRKKKIVQISFCPFRKSAQQTDRLHQSDGNISGGQAGSQPTVARVAANLTSDDLWRGVRGPRGGETLVVSSRSAAVIHRQKKAIRTVREASTTSPSDCLPIFPTLCLLRIVFDED